MTALERALRAGLRCLAHAGLWSVLTASAAANAAAPIVVLRSDTTAAFLLANGGDYSRVLAPWRAFFARQGIRARELPAEQLDSVKEPAVLILPSAVALGEVERQIIRSRLAAGWSVLGTWAVGARDDKGAWKGYGFIDEVFAAQVAPELAPGQDESFLLPFGETPLTHALPAGKRIYLKPSGAFLRVRARNVAARFGSYMREVTQPGALLGAAAYDERAGSRRAFFGFPETSWDTAQEDIDALLVGTLRWLRREPIVLKSAWPHPYQAAVLLEMDTEDKFENGLLFARLLERYGLRGTFYTLTSEGAKYPAVVKQLASKHEIGYHAEVHTGFAKLDEKTQDARMKSMIRELGTVLPGVSAAIGFRAPLEDYDATTEKQLRANGMMYHAASPGALEEALPGFSSAEPGLSADSALVVLPRTWLDDINLFRGGLLKASPAEKMLVASLQDTIIMRGFGLLSTHSQHFYAGSAMERAMARLMEIIARERDTVWVAPGTQIARWWRDREGVRLSAQHEGGDVRITLKVARVPEQRLKLVLIPPGPEAPRLESAPPGARLQKLDACCWALALPQLQKGETEVRLAF